MNSRISCDLFRPRFTREEGREIDSSRIAFLLRLSERGGWRFAAAVRKKVLRVSLLKIQTREFPRE